MSARPAARCRLERRGLNVLAVDALPADEEGNVLQGDVMVQDTHDCYVHSTSRLVAAVGMDDHIIVETKDAILVAPKERVQDREGPGRPDQEIRAQRIGLASRSLQALGSYDSIDNGERFSGEALVGQTGRSAVAGRCTIIEPSIGSW